MNNYNSPLSFSIHKGKFGNLSSGNSLTIKEVPNYNLYQIAQYKNSSMDVSGIKLLDCNFPSSSPMISSSSNARILWTAPRTWFLYSENNNPSNELNNLSDNDFAITDLSHSRAVLELSGSDAINVLKKGSPLNFNDDVFRTNNCFNTVYNGISILIDCINRDNQKLRLFCLRSFGDSFFHSIHDSCLEYGVEVL